MEKTDFEEIDEESEIKIANRGKEVYITKLVEKFQFSDQVTLCCVHRYLPMAMQVVRLFETFAITPMTKSGKVEFTVKEEDLINKETGEVYKKPIHRITITKHPDHYRFTQI